MKVIRIIIEYRLYRAKIQNINTRYNFVEYFYTNVTSYRYKRTPNTNDVEGEDGLPLRNNPVIGYEPQAYPSTISRRNEEISDPTAFLFLLKIPRRKEYEYRIPG